jgi:archaellum component FlaF (FlaF/FlaG flagellin family)
MIGLGFVFVAIINAYLEIRKAYDIILLEVSELNIHKDN